MRILTIIAGIVAFLTLVCLGAPNHAFAADLQKSMKDLDNRDRAFLSTTTPASQTWTGIWAVALAGISMTDTEFNFDVFGKGEGGTETANLAHVDGLGGEGFDATLQAGADVQVGRFVFGGWGEYSFGGTESNASVLGGAARLKVEQKDSYGACARAGLAFGDTLPYAAGCYTWASFDSKLSIGEESVKKSFDFSGPAAEVGVEHRFTPNVRGKLSARYTWFDEETVARFGDEEFGGKLTADPGVFKAMFGVVISTSPGMGLMP